jgi:uncharacterized membrane protein YoaK (UPF0700 family)
MESPTLNNKLTMLLAGNAGYVDTAGFLAFNGLFTAHVTGNFVTIGATIVHGTSGAMVKLAALPVFCAVVFLTRLASSAIARHGWDAVAALLGAIFLLLLAAAILAIWLGIPPSGDSWSELAIGMTLVAAMAVQNAAHRLHLASTPPPTLMTGTSTQIMIDLVDAFRTSDAGAHEAAAARLRKLVPAVCAFAAGCALAAAAFVAFGPWCFSVPPVLALMTIWAGKANNAVPAGSP